MKDTKFLVFSFKFLKKKDERGFTLIELLVVIVIIGLLTTLGVVNYLSARQRARDAQRKSNVQQIQSALELYRSDQHAYPASLPACNASLTDAGNTTTYMKNIPCDPSGASYYNGGTYYYNLTGSSYTLASCLENGSDTNTGVVSTSPGGSGSCSSGKWYVLTNP